MTNNKIKKLLEIPQYEQRSPEWFEQRKDKLTSSDAGTVLGLNPYSSYKEVLFDKCGIHKEFKGNVATLHGQKYEDEAIDKYCLMFDKTNYNFGMIGYGDVHTDNKYNWLGGSPDGIVQDNEDPDGQEPILLEVKCPYRRKIIPGICPQYYYPQVQLNLFITDLNCADFIEYKPPDVFNVVRYTRDEEWLNDNLPRLESFWKEVENYRKIGIKEHPEYVRTLDI